MYELYYNILNQNYAWIAPIGVLFAAVNGVVLFFGIRKKGFALGGVRGLLVGVTVAAFLAIFGYQAMGLARAHWAARKAVREGTCKTIVGQVEQYESSQKREAFLVGTVSFEYTPGSLMPGFTRYGTKSPIRNGLPVRICYLPSSNGAGPILKLEIEKR